MSLGSDVVFLDDAAWNAERECVEVTALVAPPGGCERRIRCAVSWEALESGVRLASPGDPLRLFRDLETRVAQVVARKLRPNDPEVVVTRRDIRGVSS